MTDRQRVRAVMALFERRTREGWDGYMDRWPKKEHAFTKREASAFFIGMMLDLGQPADRAWCAGRHIAANHFQKAGRFSWQVAAKTDVGTIRRIMRTGFDGGRPQTGCEYTGAYHRYLCRPAGRRDWSDMAKRLKSNAKLITDQYAGDVRRVWAGLDASEVDLIYCRLREFQGVGDALAKMGQFALVRDYGAAGGERSKKAMSVKPDVHVNRVTFRLGLVSESKARTVARELAALALDSPADFDLTVWHVGQQYCRKTAPDCGNCPLRHACDYGRAA